ncbi:MAG: CoB--CoM heterodisulfide reductase iron-sulfur subunit B family protein [Clostridiales bacterium]|nr:CoB--CoM heterodisulfide reductase iron-sulfur subunit B family protein [Clostridiales bacterium]
MSYLYYPGCSLESSAKSYDLSTRWVFQSLGEELVELEDWNCCGATMYMSTKETISLVFSARNLALAERMGGDVVAPCSSCYTILNKTNKILKENFILKAKVNQSLKRDGLSYHLKVKARHPLDVLVNDVGIDAIASRARHSLEGLNIAQYYGCQIVRPEGVFDDPENPTTMDKLFEALGGKNVYFPVKVRCCGGMLMTTFHEVALKLNKEILECAVENGADCIVTTCPLCQINLDAYQKKISKKFKVKVRIPVLFFTQLLALSMGSTPKEAGLDQNLVPVGEKILGGRL